MNVTGILVMSDYSFLQNPTRLTSQSFMFKTQKTGLQSIATTAMTKCTDKLDLNRLLELLNVTNDISLHLKVFSALSAHLMFNKGANIDIIIKCNAVYDKIHYVLSRGLPGKSSEALNFLSALLYCDTEDITSKKKALALYARNMTRVSGCLSTMCEMFSNCMMYHDTWKALCQCTAVACSECEVNQSYCSHLVPVCIEKCSQENIDLLLVLQSLLLKHSRNVQIFLDCKGVSIFTRNLLHYDKCLQLLTTVVQTSKPSTALILQTNVPADLRDFIRLYGPDSQLGQKAIIILNHISSSAKGKETLQRAFASNIRKVDNESHIEIDDVKELCLEKNVINTENDFEETKVLMQNVMKEVFKLKQSEMQNLKKNDSRLFINVGIRKPPIQNKRKIINQTINNSHISNIQNVTKTLKHINRNKRIQRNNDTEYSFSFLKNEDFKVPINKDITKIPARFHTRNTQAAGYVETQANESHFYDTTPDSKNDKATITTQDFDPVFASTPKHETVSNNNAETIADTQNSTEAKQKKYKELRLKRQNAKKKPQKAKNINNRSLGARFFSAINDSCTTIVKTVTNIFNKKHSNNDSRSKSSNSTKTIDMKDTRPSANSFMNFMKRRDAILSNNWSRNADNSVVSSVANSCQTCDNTEVLKHKLTKDEFLKQTVKKLKLGINLYGCDFKKISKTMWPREKYMTPVVLYHLYRKLLLK